MKTTIEISDNLMHRAKALARREKTTLRRLTEEGLQLVLSHREESEWHVAAHMTGARGCAVDRTGEPNRARRDR